jgi:3-deoxy-manno-octulosonate cytidylyltransferase (CMP-KDO synthetase)
MTAPLASVSIIGIIPARWGSTRFPGKPLHEICGKPLIQHVWERCQETTRLDRTLIATDDERIATAARQFGAEVAMTASDHPSGTDRIAEAAQSCPEATHVINIQGDEPLISPSLIDQLAATLAENSKISMITAANPLKVLKDREDSNIVKVVLNQHGNALYFSRSPIPFQRPSAANHHSTTPYFRHKGIYGFTREFLLQFVRWAPSPLELAEHLEQLRALENGTDIHVVITDDESIGVDTPEQARTVADLISNSPEPQEKP